MAATRPVVLASLKSVLTAGVTALSGRVYLPWEEPADNDSIMQIEVAGYRMEPGPLRYNDHFLTVRIGVVVRGKFNHQTTWDHLDAATLALFNNNTLTGNAINVTVNGGEEHLTEAGDRILWPHIEAEIHYRTAEGHL